MPICTGNSNLFWATLLFPVAGFGWKPFKGRAWDDYQKSIHSIHSVQFSAKKHKTGFFGFFCLFSIFWSPQLSTRYPCRCPRAVTLITVMLESCKVYDSASPLSKITPQQDACFQESCKVYDSASPLSKISPQQDSQISPQQDHPSARCLLPRVLQCL